MVRSLGTWLIAVGIAVGAPSDATLPISPFRQPTLYECAAATDQAIRASALQSGHREPDPVMDARRIFYQALVRQAQGVTRWEIGRLATFESDPIRHPLISASHRQTFLSRCAITHEQVDPPLPADNDQAMARCYVVSSGVLWRAPDGAPGLDEEIPDEGSSVATSVKLSSFRRARGERDVDVFLNVVASAALAEPANQTFAKCIRRFSQSPKA